jgi:hypothetical protein
MYDQFFDLFTIGDNRDLFYAFLDRQESVWQRGKMINFKIRKDVSLAEAFCVSRKKI